MAPKLYRSLEEVRDVPPEEVESLALAGEGPIPEGLWRYTALRKLRLEGFRGPVDARIGTLSELRTLQLTALDAETLPEELGRLEKLHSLYIVRCRALTTLPGLSRLTSLRSLDLNGCASLGVLPPSVLSLRRLTYLILRDCGLRTLPEGFGRMGRLETLDLSDNPFESLPADLAEIDRRARVRASARVRALYRVVAYPHAGPADREARLASSDAALRERLLAAVESVGMSADADVFLRSVRRAVALRPSPVQGDGGWSILDFLVSLLGPPRAPAVPLPLGHSRIGGAPDLPPDHPYPVDGEGQHWSFVAQLDLAALAPHQRYLPRDGWLYFFAREYPELGPEEVRVRHWRGPVDRLTRYDYPRGVRFVNPDQLDPGPPAALQPEAAVTLPSTFAQFLDPETADLALVELFEERSLDKRRRALNEGLEPRDGTHLINGHVFTQHRPVEAQAAHYHGGLPEEWVPLLVIGYDNYSGLWPADEDLVFLIHEADLAREDFSRVVATCLN